MEQLNTETLVDDGLVESAKNFDLFDKVGNAIRSVADNGQMDSGYGFGGADFWPVIDGVELYVHVKRSKPIKRI